MVYRSELGDSEKFRFGAAHRRRRSIAVIVGGLLALSACGSPDQAGDVVASVGDTTPGSPDVSAETDSVLIWAEYEQCMKEQGIDVSRGSDTGGNEVESGGGTLPDLDADELNAASEACDPLLDDFSLYDTMSEDDQIAADEYDLLIQQCVADKGFDVQTPNGDGNDVGDEPIVDAAPSGQGSLEDAYNECEEQNPPPAELEEAWDQ